MTERLPNTNETGWQNIMGAGDGAGGFLRVTHNDDGTLRPTLGQTISPAQLTANTNDWNPTGLATASMIRFSTDAIRDLTGITAATDGRILILLNIGSFRLQLVNESTLSSAANRLSCAASANDVLPIYPNQSVMLVYSTTDGRWRVFTGANKGAGTPLVAGTATAGTLRYYSSEDHVHPSEGVASSTYTPTLTQSGAVTKTVTYANYIQVGKLVFVWVYLTLTGAGTTNNPIIVGLPVASVTYPVEHVLGVAKYEDSSVGLYMLHAFWATTTTIKFWRTDTLPTASFGADPNFAAASGDTLSFTLVYEAA